MKPLEEYGKNSHSPPEAAPSGHKKTHFRVEVGLAGCWKQLSRQIDPLPIGIAWPTRLEPSSGMVQDVVVRAAIAAHNEYSPANRRLPASMGWAGFMGRCGKTTACVLGYNGRQKYKIKGGSEDFFDRLQDTPAL